jgi:ABC-2 type transport system ATP-binding protein
MDIIKVENVKKDFKKYSRESGLWNALKSFFHREYEVINAIRTTSFGVEKGEILGYLGPNGAGKSTMIKLLTGILYPDTGKIEVMALNLQRQEKYVQNIGLFLGKKARLTGSSSS